MTTPTTSSAPAETEKKTLEEAPVPALADPRDTEADALLADFQRQFGGQAFADFRQKFGR